MIEDQYFGSERQCVAQGLPGIAHLVQTKLKVHDITAWGSFTEVRMDNLYSTLQVLGDDPCLPLANRGGVLVNDNQFLGVANKVHKLPGSNRQNFFAGKIIEAPEVLRHLLVIGGHRIPHASRVDRDGSKYELRALPAVPYVHHVSILHDVVLAFQAQRAFGAGVRFRACF